MKFAEFHAGQRITAGPYLLSEAEILAFAKQYDPQWFHTDVGRAQSGPFNGLIASGWQTCAIAMRLVADAALHDSESFASPGIDHVKWPAPVRPGDALSLVATVLETRITSKGMGVLRWRWELRNQADVQVLELEAVSLFKLAKPF